jgi:starch synthase
VRPAPRVVHLVAEYWPYAQTGGLAEAVRGLAVHQARSGMEVTVVLPLYRGVREGPATLEPVGPAAELSLGGEQRTVRVWHASGASVEPGPEVLFVEHDPFFDRDGLYGDGGADYPDNPLRFALFGRAVAERIVAPKAAEPGREPVVVHIHDWHAAPALLYLPAGTGPGRAARVLTVHNAAFQGRFGIDLEPELSLPGDGDVHGTLEWDGELNFLKAALVLADVVTTVSPTHATELCTEEGGFGLDPMFRELGDRLIGILNGIDTELWDPADDEFVPPPFVFDADDPSGKLRAKEALQRAAGLPVRPEVPLFGMAARLARQKGIDLLLEGRCLERAPAQFILLGSGDRWYEENLVARARPDRVVVDALFSERKEHELLAAADSLLMPSLYEPCGLTQMRAQRYGALPVARRVGGLADTIEDGVTGFLFGAFEPGALDDAVDRAIQAYGDAAGWAAMRRTAMHRPFGWSEPAAAYAALYGRALARRGGA